MLLAIDVGNTQTIIGLFEATDDDLDDPNRLPARSRCEVGLLDHWRISTNPERTADEHALVVQ